MSSQLLLFISSQSIDVVTTAIVYECMQTHVCVYELFCVKVLQMSYGFIVIKLKGLI